jgi:methionine synthase / methylenetetrahydrofolate reductase(NADPH)
LTAQPNAGPPTLVRGQFQYTADPAYFARLARAFVDVGARLVGGCCGTTPAHIQSVAASVDASRALPDAPRPARARRVGSPAMQTEQAPAAQSVGGLLERIARGAFVFACELAPPAGPDPHAAVSDALALRDAGCQALIVGPVASTRAQVSPASVALLVQQRVPGLDVVVTATTWDKSLLVLQADLLGAYAFGIRHVVCRTGTPPPHGDYPNAAGVWEVDSRGLIEVLHGLNDGRDYNGIPTGAMTNFVIGARINPGARDLEQEVALARQKLAAGVNFFVTSPVFDLHQIERVLDVLEPWPPVPVLLGLMPLADARHAEYLVHEVPDMSVPASIVERMLRAGDRAAQVGCDIVRELAQEARRRGRVQGIVLSGRPNSTAELSALLPMLLA